MTITVTIARDSFSRLDIVRSLIDKDNRTDCAWCGSSAKFNYGVWHDGIHTKPQFSPEAFCSKNCWLIYIQ